MSKKTTKKAPKKAAKKVPKKEEKKIGRPTKYEDWMAEEAVEYLSKGRTKRALAGHLNIVPDTLYNWMKLHKPFSDGISLGLAKAEGEFCEKLIEGMFTETIYDRDKKTTTSRAMNTGIATLYANGVLGWNRDLDKQNNFSFNISYDPNKLKDEE